MNIEIASIISEICIVPERSTTSGTGLLLDRDTGTQDKTRPESRPRHGHGTRVTGSVILFPINYLVMGGFQLLPVFGGFGLWIRFKFLGSDCNNRFPGLTLSLRDVHNCININHNSDDRIILP